jgi:ferrous iron transport protein A
MSLESQKHASGSASTATASSSVRLSEIAADRSAVIVSVDSDAPQGRRLLDLGFLPGTPVRVVRRAPLGDPIQFEIRGCNLCLRKSEADGIRVLEE